MQAKESQTEQDRARQIAKDIREEFAMDLMVGTADNLYDNFEDAVYRRFAAALQAERERTRAEEWQLIETAPRETPNVLVCMTNGTLLVARCDLGHWKIVGASLQTMYATPTHWMPLPDPPSALGAAQLPQGETK